VNPESIQRAADHYARFYHETPDDAEAARDAQNMLRLDQLIAARDALDELLTSDLSPGTVKEFVRRHANRLSFDDEHARTFVADTLAVLDTEIAAREAGS
jgi:hypothetical protein